MKKSEVTEIKKELTEEQVTHIINFAEDKNIYFGRAPGDPSYYHKGEMFMFLEIWELSDDEYEHLESILKTLQVEYAYGRDSFWFLISKED